MFFHLQIIFRHAQMDCWFIWSFFVMCCLTQRFKIYAIFFQSMVYLCGSWFLLWDMETTAYWQKHNRDVLDKYWASFVQLKEGKQCPFDYIYACLHIQDECIGLGLFAYIFPSRGHVT